MTENRGGRGLRFRILCPKLEPGQCGVGDYSRRLASELFNAGATVEVVATHDPDVRSIQNSEWHTCPEPPIHYVRIPYHDAVGRRAFFFESDFRPDITIWQFSSFYSLRRWGLPPSDWRWLFASRERTRFSIVCHEVWLQPVKRWNIKRRMISLWQRRTLISLIKQLKPYQLFTHLPLYADILRDAGLVPSLLPIFGNIPSSTHAAGWTRSELSRRGIPTRSLIAGIFGAIHPGWDPSAMLARLLRYANSIDMPLVLAVIGRNGTHAEPILKSLEARFGHEMRIAVLGSQDPARVSDFLSCLDFGLSTNPSFHTGKSSTVAAMIEHGVPVIVANSEVEILRSGSLPLGAYPFDVEFSTVGRRPSRSLVAENVSAIIGIPANPSGASD